MGYKEYVEYCNKVRTFLFTMKPNQVFELKKVSEENLPDFKAISHLFLCTSKDHWRYEINADFTTITRNGSLPEQSFEDWLDLRKR